MNSSPDSSLETALKTNSVDLLHYFQWRTQDDSAADLLAETMLVAWQREQDSPAAAQDARMWLFGIARNVLKNSERGQRRRHRLASKLKTMLRPEETSQAADAGAEVRDAVRSLEPELAELVCLVHWEGFSIADAGQVLGLQASTARGRYQRAKGQLRTALEEPEAPAAEQRCTATLPQVQMPSFPHHKGAP